MRLTVIQILNEAKARNAIYPSESLSWMIEWIEGSMTGDANYQARYYEKHKIRKKLKAQK